MRSNSFLLDAAFGSQDPIQVLFPPTPAQFGALRCHEAMGRITNRADWGDLTNDSVEALTQLWCGNDSSFWADFSAVIQKWASSGDASAGAAIGHWLTWVRQHGLLDTQVEQLTRFLAEPRFAPKHYRSKSVRRYPTGGISEKQAILLPAVLRFLSDSLGFHSSFLIARRLAHTGGTSDKLRILPGFRVHPASELSDWDGTSPPVRYFTADANFCPRDEALYFLRGETGTVRQLGLIVGSIAAKQYALQADLTVLDVLYGDGAFFRTLEEAESFQRLACAVSTSLKFPLEFSIRPTSSVAWKSIGNATEVAEIIELLHAPDLPNIPVRSELRRATEFAARLVSGLGMSEDDVHAKILEGWRDGELLSNLIALWREHKVDKSFLTDIESQGSNAILNRLKSAEILAPCTGRVCSTNVVQLADLINNQLNSYRPSAGGLPLASGVGGLMLEVALGERVEAGQPLARVYSSEVLDSQVLESISANVVVVEDSE